MKNPGCALKLTVISRKNIMLRQGVMEHLHIRRGDKVAVVLLPDGRLALKAARDRPDIG